MCGVRGDGLERTRRALHALAVQRGRSQPPGASQQIEPSAQVRIALARAPLRSRSRSDSSAASCAARVSDARPASRAASSMCAEPRMHRQTGHLAAQRGEPPRCIQGAQTRQQRLAPDRSIGAGGASSQSRRAASESPQRASSSASGARSASRISGGVAAANERLRALAPEPVADAGRDPSGAARGAARSPRAKCARAPSRLMPRDRIEDAIGEPARSRPRAVTPGMVRLVSAMLVASTTLRMPGRCRRQHRVLRLRRFIWPYSGSTRTFGGNVACGSAISTRGSRRLPAGTPARRRLIRRVRERCRGRYRRAERASLRTSAPLRAAAVRASDDNAVVTGKARPGTVDQRGIAEQLRRRARTSSVADMMSRCESRRPDAARASRPAPGPDRPARLRSWNSSKITQADAFERRILLQQARAARLRSPPRCASRARPAYRAACDSRRSAPTSSPSSVAMRAATARAASRRGSSIRILPSPSHGSLEQRQRHERALAGAGRRLPARRRDAR